jgi:hypothetical protein
MEGNMATSKAKRPVLLAQPKPQRRSLNPEPLELMPVRAHVYRTIADMNGGFEHAIEGLQILQKINYLRSDGLNAIHDLVCRIRAQANRELIAVLNDREMANLGHFDQLCVEREKAQPAADR